MRQLGLFGHQDLKEFTKWDSGCEISGKGGTSGGQNFQMWDIRVEMVAERDSGCETPGWKWRRRRIPGVTPEWKMTAQKDSGYDTWMENGGAKRDPGVRHPDWHGRHRKGSGCETPGLTWRRRKGSGCETPGWGRTLLWVACRTGITCMNTGTWVSCFNGYDNPEREVDRLTRGMGMLMRWTLPLRQLLPIF